jgi:hypothetical protein
MEDTMYTLKNGEIVTQESLHKLFVENAEVTDEIADDLSEKFMKYPKVLDNLVQRLSDHNMNLRDCKIEDFHVINEEGIVLNVVRPEFSQRIYGYMICSEHFTQTFDWRKKKKGKNQ